MLSNCCAREDSWESPGLQDQTSQCRKPTLNIHWKNWCWSWSSNTLATWCEESSSVQSFSHVWLFRTPWTSARQVSLSITNYRILFKLMSIEWVMPSNQLILCCPLLLLPSVFTALGSFPMSQFFTQAQPWCWERLNAKGEGANRGWDS